MRLFAFIITALLSASTLAHEPNCDLTLNGEVNLQNGVLTATTESGQQLRLNGERAWLDDAPMQISASQQALLDQYYSHSVALAPKVADVALDALDLARDGIDLAFGELFGPDDELVRDLSAELDTLSQDVRRKFYADDGSLQFDSNAFKDTYLNKDFEQKLERTVEDAVSRSVGKLMMKIGRQMIGGGDPEGFEEQMANFSQRIEQQMEQKTKQIERNASQLCDDFVGLNDLENRIQRQIPELAELDLIRLSGPRLK